MSQSGRGRGGRSSEGRQKIATVMSQEHRLELAKMVRDNKSLLIGKFSSTVTQKARDRKWTEIFAHLTELGAIIEDVNMLRFSVYTNLPKATKKKRDLARSTGQGPPNYTELDHVILDIIGRDSAASIGIRGASGDDDVNMGFDERDPLRDASILDETSESLFGAALSNTSTFTTPSQMFARKSAPVLPPPATPRTATSSPIPPEATETFDTASRKQNSKNRSRGPLTSILVDESYKKLKLEKLQLDLEEQKSRMNLLSCQIETEKLKADKLRLDIEEQRRRMRLE